jgi:hypothetical protein
MSLEIPGSPPTLTLPRKEGGDKSSAPHFSSLPPSPLAGEGLGMGGFSLIRANLSH